MPNNKELFESWAAKHGIVEKSEGGVIDLSGVNFGGIIPAPLVESMITMMRDQSQWLSAIDTRVRARMSGYVPIVDLAEPVMEYVGENDATKVTTKPPTKNVPFSTKKFKSEIYFTTEELREAVQAGIEGFEEKMTADWTAQMANDVANIVMNSDNSITDTSTRLNRMLRAVNGVAKVTDTGANVFDAEGKAFDLGIFAAMIDYMPDKYANDPNLQWLFNRRVNTHFHSKLTNTNTTERMRSDLGDTVLTTQAMVSPEGYRQIIVPQIPNNMGPTPLAPTSAAASGGGIELVLTTLITATYVASVAAGVGRKFKVTYLPSGQSEICTGYDDTTLKILTVGKLGQTTVSTTASDYLVTLADETSIYFGNPKNVVIVYCNEWRAYREFNKDFDRWEVTTYVELDVLVPTPETMVKFNRVRVTQLSW